MSAHISSLVACRKKKQNVLIIIIIAAHTREPREVGGGFQSSQCHVGLNPYYTVSRVIRRRLPLGGSYTVVSIFSMISIMDLEGDSREQSS